MYQRLMIVRRRRKERMNVDVLKNLSEDEKAEDERQEESVLISENNEKRRETPKTTKIAERNLSLEG